MIYDIFYVATRSADSQNWKLFKERFPTARLLENVTEFNQISPKSFTKFFWVIWDEVVVADNFNFEYRVAKWDEGVVHAFRNGKCFDGVCIFNKNFSISKREFENRFFAGKKDVDILASYPRFKTYDIVFISYNEINADKNYQRLIDRFPNAKRLHGVKGIHQAHIEAAKLVDTEMFWVVDGDAVITDDFKFNYEVAVYDHDVVHVWRSKNPINNLVYGYGGVKLLPTKMTMNMKISNADMTTSISKKFKAVKEISNITEFNTDEFNTWKSAFRECVKLSSRSIMGQHNSETAERLDIWKTVGHDKLYGKYAIQGAIDGEEYGLEFKEDKKALMRINDFDWLREYYEQRTKNIHS